MWEYWERRAFPAKQKNTSSNENTKSQKCTNKRKPNHKYTNKQNNQNLGKHTQPSCVQWEYVQ